MSRSWLLALVIFGLSLAGCISPTAAPTSALPTGAPPTGYPAFLPSSTSPATGYPAATLPPTQTPGDYPAGATVTDSPASATPGPTDTAVPSATSAPTGTPAPTATTGPVIITYRNYEILPATTTIKAGTLVTFVIEGDKHQPYAGAAAPFIFESPPDLQNTTWSITFNNARTMTILCGYHGNMTATLIVEP